MKSLSIRTQRIAVLVGLFVVSFALYAAAESGSQSAEVALLTFLVLLMVVTIRVA